MNKKPWQLRFLEWFCPPELYESIEGDLLEEYYTDVTKNGSRTANARLFFNVLRFFRPGIIARNKFSSQLIETIMIRNYIKVAVRNILKRKFYSFINAFGLSIGIAFCILVYLFINDENSFDRFQENKDLIYRIHNTEFSSKAFEKDEKNPYESTVNLPAKLGEAMLDELPEVQYMTRFTSMEYGTVRCNDKVFKQKITFIDSGFFKMFSFPLIHGDREKLFKNPSEVVLTDVIAKKYFGDENPIGKIFTYSYEKEQSFTVAGVIQSPPANSSLQFEILLPMSARPWFENTRQSWSFFVYPTFVQLHSGTNLQNFKSHLDLLSDKYLTNVYKDLRDIRNVPPQFKVSEFNFTKLTDIHLSSEISWDKVSDPKYSWIMRGIALLILVIACINYVLLALTTSTTRRIEVGVRKVIGANKTQLMYQFIFESLLLAWMSMILGIVLVILFLPSFNEFTCKAIELSNDKLVSILALSFALAIVVGTLAAGYPSLLLSRFLPAQVLKGRFGSYIHTGFTKPLVGFQFFLSASLIICSIVMIEQLKFIVTKDLGYNREQIIVLDNQAGWNGEASKTVETLRNHLQNDVAIQSVAGTNVSFSNGWSKGWYNAGNMHNKVANLYVIDHHYIPLLELEFVEGRNFDSALESDKSGVIVNEAFMREMGWDTSLEQYVFLHANPAASGHKVIGVVKDFHYQSLEQKIEPLIFCLEQDYLGVLGSTMIKIAPGYTMKGVNTVRNAFTKLFPDRPFVYSFIEDDVARQYESYERWMNITGLSAIFAILIACLGLFGLSGINTMNRTKEIGIRKIMGAQLSGIFLLLNKQYAWLSLIAYILAIPFSWFGMKQWLDNFQFKIDMGIELFVLAIGAGLLVTMLTVSYHAIKAASINPADTLKHE